MKFCIEIDGAAVGGIGVHPGQDVYRHTATVGYWLGEQFWGRGIMTEAVTAVTDFISRAIMPVSATIAAPANAGRRRIAKSESPRSSWLNRRSKIDSGG